MGKKSKKKKDKNASLLHNKTLSINELFEQTASSINSTLSPASFNNNIVLTPLSSEACLKHGVNPEMLRKRAFESFHEPHMDPVIQRMKYDAYMKRREEWMTIVSKEKDRLEQIRANKIYNKQNSDGINHDFATAQLTNCLTQKDTDRILFEKARDRQRQELLHILAEREIKKEDQKRLEKKAREREAKEERIRREKQKRERIAAENKRIRELRRKAQEDAEEEMQRLASQELHEKEILRMKEQEKQKEILKEKARKMEEERNRKREEHKLQTAKRLQKQRKEILKRQSEREERERQRLARVEVIKKQEKEEFEARQNEIKERINANQEAARLKEEKRKTDLMIKQQESQQLLMQRERDKQLQLKQKQLYMSIQAHKKKIRLQVAKENEELKKDFIQKKFEAEEEHLLNLQEIKKRNQLIAKEKRDIRAQLKRENVERIKRMHDYKRIETQRKVIEGDKRIQDMLEKKEKTIKERKKAAHGAKRQKDEILGILQQSKTSGSRSIKKILASLTSDDYAQQRKKNNTKKNKPKFRCLSAGRLKGPPINSLGPPPYAPSLENRLAKSADPVERYTSPYMF